MSTEKKPLEKVCLICAKGSLEDVYASLVMANGAVMEGIETKVFFTFFGLDGITKKAMNHLHTATTGNPAMRMPGGIPFPTMLGGLPGIESAVSSMMRKQMEALDMPPVDEFLEMITAGGGEDVKESAALMRSLDYRKKTLDAGRKYSSEDLQAKYQGMERSNSLL